MKLQLPSADEGSRRRRRKLAVEKLAAISGKGCSCTCLDAVPPISHSISLSRSDTQLRQPLLPPPLTASLVSVLSVLNVSLALAPFCVSSRLFWAALPVAACPQRFQFDKHPGAVQKRPYKRLLPRLLLLLPLPLLLLLLLLLCIVCCDCHSRPSSWAIS